ncbi:uncharacterized protein B0H18DRAFT_994021 [Fomitopsis serialis]|uniref:uncharacterized protein n=1 Tax=Fomitopsis serialis TaxID=139415 RepID=UPI0020074DF8|nr:uncharacterized protein B0H18DRAFT_994021 [Neoantrodia serialis]KAH9930258.1 hypothetical protein B0H18DRAFT_994021 [Neoantrodia serialis]
MMFRTTATLARAPFVFRRSFSTASLPRPRPLAFAPTTLRTPTSLLQRQLIVRGVASSVSNKPGSQTVRQAAVNIKEELGNSGADFAKSVAGANWFHDAVVANPKRDTFLGITNSVAQSVPPAYITFGLFGGLPYLGTGAVTIYMAQQAGTALSDLTSRIDPGVAITMLDHALHIQMTYGAVMLSFLGAIHWGLEFAGYGGQKSYRRLVLGACPVVFGWSTLALQPVEALIAQWVAFTWLWWADLRATNAGWAPGWYSQYRFYLTLLAGTCIIGTLAATSYWGPVGGHGLVSHDLHMIRALRQKQDPESAGFVAGEIESVSHDGDAYVLVRRRRAPQPEDGGEQEAEEQ